MYKIAIATSDGVNVDLHFGTTEVFLIYKAEGEKFEFLESRRVANSGGKPSTCKCGGCGSENSGSESCGGEKSDVVEALSDCRAVVCAKIGRNVLKQLEARAISSFDVTVPVKDALERIVSYYYKVDNRLFQKLKINS